MAERIPEGTKRRHRMISVENACSDCGIRTRTNTDSRGTDRVARAAMITKCDLVMIEIDRGGKNWANHYSVSRMVLRDRPQRVNFMLIVTDPSDVSTREITKISR